jgi:hypothetical protein
MSGCRAWRRLWGSLYNYCPWDGPDASRSCRPDEYMDFVSRDCETAPRHSKHRVYNGNSRSGESPTGSLTLPRTSLIEISDRETILLFIPSTTWGHTSVSRRL